MSATQKTQVVDKQFMPEAKEKQFQTVVKAFENQQWAKGLKLVEPLLKEFPENGKLISMKAILKYNVDKDVVEAEAGLKRGMMLGRRTSLCWHLYGIFQRTQKKYAEAKKAFQLAHSLDPLNIQIIVDLSDLQVQVRDYAGYRVSKQKLMNERSGNGVFWIGFIMGAFLDKKYELCIDIITSYLPSVEQKPSYQIQELLFIQAECYAFLKKWDKAVETIQNGMKFILNETKAKEQLTVYYLQQQDFTHAQEILSSLLASNCDNKYYFILYECILLKRVDTLSETDLPSFTTELSSEERTHLLKEYQSLFSTYSKSIFLPLVLLNLMEGEEFTRFLTQRTYNAIRKGIPSFFQSLIPIVSKSSSKLEILKGICTAVYKDLKECNTLEGEEVEPFVFLWLVLILAEIEDFERHYERALQYVDEAIEHTPTCYDAYRLKSKICKHAGYLKQSEAMMEFSYELDKFDRYMNTKCVKACLKACEIEKADEIISYWTRSNVPCRIDLETLEACWFELRCGTAYLRRKDYPHAMKLFNNVLKHFETFIGDQFDFHGYVLRKSILTAYTSFLRSLDNLYNHRYFKTAAIGALKCACAVFDEPINEGEYSKHFPLTKPTVHKKGAEYTDDKDPDGLQFIQDPKLFSSFQTTCTQLLQFAKSDREAMMWVFEWASRKKDSKMCEEAIENLKTHCHAKLDAVYCSKRLHPEMVYEEEGVMNSIHDRTIKAKLLLLDNSAASVYEIISNHWEQVQYSCIQEFVECYEVLSQNDSEKLSDFIHLVQSFYPGFEETIQCWIHSCVCLIITN